MRIRSFRRGDEAALAEICVRTADSGRDATGLLTDDAIWGEIFVLPYVARHPDLAFVVEREPDELVAVKGAAGGRDAGNRNPTEGEGAPRGYIVCAPDTDAFEAWFRDSWWPPRATRWPLAQLAPGSRTHEILSDAAARAPGRESAAARFPAHLHIDLLPDAQGQGMGRMLVETLFSALRERGVRGIHLGATAANTAAHAFYDRLGFTRVPSSPGAQMFTRPI